MTGDPIPTPPHSSPPTASSVLKGPAILQLVPRLDTGGAERTAIDVSAALARAGYTPLIATQGGRMLDELREAGGEWIAMQVHSKAPPTLAANVLRLRRLIASRNVVLVHARSRAPRGARCSRHAGPAFRS